jgi:hypothetical protein
LLLRHCQAGPCQHPPRRREQQGRWKFRVRTVRRMGTQKAHIGAIVAHLCPRIEPKITAFKK